MRVKTTKVHFCIGTIPPFGLSHADNDARITIGKIRTRALQPSTCANPSAVGPRIIHFKIARGAYASARACFSRAASLFCNSATSSLANASTLRLPRGLSFLFIKPGWRRYPRTTHYSFLRKGDKRGPRATIDHLWVGIPRTVKNHRLRARRRGGASLPTRRHDYA